eukprot:7997988-Ditylum_brightwellii.AAC.1
MGLQTFEVPWKSNSKEHTRDLILVVRRSCSCCGRDTGGMLSIGWPGRKGVGLVVDELVDELVDKLAFCINCSANVG